MCRFVGLLKMLFLLVLVCRVDGSFVLVVAAISKYLQQYLVFGVSGGSGVSM